MNIVHKCGLVALAIAFVYNNAEAMAGKNYFRNNTRYVIAIETVDPETGYSARILGIQPNSSEEIIIPRYKRPIDLFVRTNAGLNTSIEGVIVESRIETKGRKTVGSSLVLEQMDLGVELTVNNPYPNATTTYEGYWQ